MKDLSYEDYMTEWLKDPGHVVANLMDYLEEGDCETRVLALERIFKSNARVAAIKENRQ